jgi:hypothetical protein
MNVFAATTQVLTLGVPLSDITGDMAPLLLAKGQDALEGKCVEAGFVKPASVSLMHYSAGLVDGDQILYSVHYACLTFCPFRGQRLVCIVNELLGSGVTALSPNVTPSPFMVFLHRREVVNVEAGIETVQVGDHITVEVVLHRYQMGDKDIEINAHMLCFTPNDIDINATAM